MVTRLITFFLCLFSIPATAQFWLQSGGGATIDEATDVAADASGNRYVTGYFTTNVSFEGHSMTSSGIDDIFLFKTDAAGFVSWVKTAGGPNSDKALSVDADPAGNTVVTGFFYLTADFDGQPVSSSGQQDIFVAKYDPSGALLWVRKAGGTGSDAGNCVTFDASGNVLVTGEFTGSCSFGNVTLTSFNGSIDVFTAKYDGSGNLLWAKKGSGLATDRGTSVSTDASGNVYVAGMFSDTITFDQVHNNTMYNAMFLIKYDDNGNEQWFRWMGSGSTVYMGGVDVRDNNVHITGNFTGTLFFFGASTNPMLGSGSMQNIFVCRYDLQGGITWTHADGSSSDVASKAVVTKSNGEVLVAGNFKCRFDDLSAQYGSGIFCSIGFWDTFIASYDNSGSRMWARHFGGREDDFVYGLSIDNADKPVLAGSFHSAYITPYRPSAFTDHGVYNQDYYDLFASTNAYCNDGNYERYIERISQGNKDFYVNANVDLSREPYDFFHRSGSGCDRPYRDICVDEPGFGIPNCPDTITSCYPVYLGGYPGGDSILAPWHTYIWNTGSTNSTIQATASGVYAVTMTNLDGCFVNTDSIYFQLNPSPPEPAITDSKGININAVATQPIHLCLPDSVQLTCTNAGSNTVQWMGFPAGMNPVTVSTANLYSCTLTNSFGCQEINSVSVTTANALPPVQPEMVCLNDSDANDTIELCLGEYFQMFIYDTLSNPGGLLLNCFPGTAWIEWMSTSASFLSFNASTTCNSNFPSANQFRPTQTGDFDFLISAWLHRENACDTDSVFVNRNLHVVVHPAPPDTPINLAIAGDPYVCSGDSVMLVVTPGNHAFNWSTGETNDTIYASIPGTYYVVTSEIVTNAFGCSVTNTGNAYFYLSAYPQPVVTMNPSDGLICPNDSVQLICSGTTGTFTWQGPNGTLPFTTSSIYDTTPGFYYCIQSVTADCDLLSNTVEVIQYNTPLIIASPAPAICNHDSVVLLVSTNPGSTLQWQSPLSGSNPSQTVFTAGTYSCTVTSCGIVTPVSLTVVVDSAEALITADGPLTFCMNDSVALSANAGPYQYTWLPTGETTQTIYAHQGGTFSLITTSTGGCRDTADIALALIPDTLSPPVVWDTVICSGESVTLTASVTATVYWASQPDYASVIHSGFSFTTPPLLQTSTYYLFSDPGTCRSVLDSVTVLIMDNCDTLTIPNIITPNDDGKNELFPGRPGNYAMDLIVFNRWGNKVFEGDGLRAGWNGTNDAGVRLNDGTYYYTLHVLFDSGVTRKHHGYVRILGSNP